MDRTRRIIEAASRHALALRFIAGLALGAAMMLTTACGGSYALDAERGPTDPSSFALAAQPAAPQTAAAKAQIALGEALFSDTRLSGDGRRSCASCHQADKGFGDGLIRSPARDGTPLPRHTPALLNVAHASSLFWDGRAATLEQQAWGPITNPAEMGGDKAVVAQRIAHDPQYRARFAAAFAGRVPDTDTIAAALAAYQRTLLSGRSPFDRWAEGKPDAIAPAAARGFALFVGKARCATCHTGSQLSDGRFHDIGLESADQGRGAITGKRRDRQAFRTPGLRDIARTAPYMHDGALASLEAVVGHYSDDVIARRGTPPQARLTPAEKRDLVALLQSLSSE